VNSSEGLREEKKRVSFYDTPRLFSSYAMFLYRKS